MQILKTEQLSKTYGDKLLFQGLNFIIEPGHRVGLIGTNGTGKTSLLNVLAGVDSADRGEIIKPNEYKISYLQQDPELDHTKSVYDAILGGNQPVLNLISAYEQVIAKLNSQPDNRVVVSEFEKLQEQMNQADAWQTETDIKTMLSKLHIEKLDAKVADLSGGQVKRVALAQALIAAPDLLILDEPTNHLDFDSIEWLEKYLSQFKGSILFVTHDRYFLDRVANRVWELDHGNLTEYQGNYAKYVEQKAAQQVTQQQILSKQKRLYQQELEWIKRGPKARGTKQQARIDRFNDLKDNIDQTPVDDGQLQVGFAQRRLGKKVIKIEDANYQINGKAILTNFSNLIQAGERIGITGDNGVGKSTFLNLIAGKRKLDSGIIDIGETVHLGYYTQQTEPIPDDQRMINYLADVGQEIINNNGERVSITNLLEQFLFPSSMHGTLIRKLSGGEKRRLYLIKILMQRPNVLLLDEPTNDLDIATLTVLEDYLRGFNGTILTVSHDRYFLDKVSDRLLIFEGDGQVTNYHSSISEYLKTKADEQTTSPKKTTIVPIKEKAKKRTYKEQQEWQNIEDDIEKIEMQKEKLSEAMLNTNSDYGKLRDLQQQFDQVEQELTVKMNRWEYLASFEE